MHVCYEFVIVKLNGARKVIGVLRGFDPFMNLVIDEAIEETKAGDQNSIGMVVCIVVVNKFSFSM